MASVITAIRAFNLDHLSAEIGQQLSCPRTRQNPAHIEYTITFEWACHSCPYESLSAKSLDASLCSS